MKLYNTLTKKIEDFKPQAEKATIYTCGPTVYDTAHIGNLRTYLFEDFLKRSLIFAGFEVNQVMNITDIDDKTIKKSQGKKDELGKITREYEKLFLADIHKLNILPPEELTRATEYIEKMIGFISDLMTKGFAYKADDSSVYFSIAKFPGYGKLSGLDNRELKTGARVSQDEYDKENPADFVLWKAWDEADGEIAYDSPFGKGRPGWHIECSTMANDTLGDTIDIHAGAVDLIFPHHENEIAQSEVRSGKQFARFWVHGEHLLVDGKKMSKSENNFYKLSDLEEKGFSPLDFRYLCFASHYRSKLNFTWEGLTAAKNARMRLVNIVSELSGKNKGQSNKSENQYYSKFKSQIENDLNTPEALATIWEMLRDDNIGSDEKLSTLKLLDEKILSLDLFVSADIPDEIKELAIQRESARNGQDWQKADQIRTEIEEKGYIVKDTETGSKLSKK